MLMVCIALITKCCSFDRDSPQKFNHNWPTRAGAVNRGTGVTFAPERGSHSPLNQKGSHSPLNHNTFNVVLNPLGLNLGTRGHLGGLGNL